MARPRKITVVATKHFTKEELEMRKNAEKRLGTARDALLPPKWLSKDAAEEFSRVVDETEAIGILDNLDLTVLAIYADAYSHYTKLAKDLQKRGPVIHPIGGDGHRKTQINPALQAQKIFVERIYQASTKLGLATTDRLRLIVPHKEEKKENKFLGLIHRA